MTPVKGALTRARDRWPSRIALRLLAFNLLLLFLPVAGILYLDVYETGLLEAQERAMVQQGRLLAAALSDPGTDTPGAAMSLLGRLGERGDARIRVYDAAGALVADTNRLRFAGEPSAGASPYSPPSRSPRTHLLYRVGAFAVEVRQAISDVVDQILRRRAATFGAEDAAAALPEVTVALRGRYGTATRQTPGQRSLTLYSALPVRRGQTVIGAVLVSQSTFRVLQALYDVRLRIFAVVVASLGAAALLTGLAAATVVRPLGRLRREAADLADRRSRLPGRFQDVHRRDEIGDLARALQELTRRLDEHIRSVEQFASDVSHEFKNPLAAIRTAAEMAGQAELASDRTRFLGMLQRDVDRLERLVSDVRELAHIDTQLEQEPMAVVDVGRIASQVVEGLRLAHPAWPEVALSATGHPRVLGSADRFAQAIENLVSNACSFAPAGTAVEMQVAEDGGRCRVLVSDRGPGIPPAHLERIFDRFFTYRPADDRQREHAGLGLAIARTVVQGYGGTITAANRNGGGASFEILLPVAPSIA